MPPGADIPPPPMVREPPPTWKRLYSEKPEEPRKTRPATLAAVSIPTFAYAETLRSTVFDPLFGGGVPPAQLAPVLKLVSVPAPVQMTVWERAGGDASSMHPIAKTAQSSLRSILRMGIALEAWQDGFKRKPWHRPGSGGWNRGREGRAGPSEACAGRRRNGCARQTFAKPRQAPRRDGPAAASQGARGRLSSRGCHPPPLLGRGARRARTGGRAGPRRGAGCSGCPTRWTARSRGRG